MEPTRRNITSYRELIVWQKSVDLVTEIYSATSKLPREGVFGLTSQLRRCAVSVPSNIAEGQGRATKGEFIQFLSHARGSLFELETQLHIADKLEYLALEHTQSLESRAEEVARILNGLLSSLGVASRKLSTIH
jgi:four helix bundle protein